MSTKPDKGRLIILGGGIASLTAAYYASEPDCDIVFPGGIYVYEMSNRLGGKGASGRSSTDRVENRIEEHGLHVWFGFYDNAFRLLAACHDYLEEEVGKDPSRPRWATSLRTIEDGFRRSSRIGVTDYDGASWLHWVADFPEDARRPWDPRDSTDAFKSASALTVQALRLAEALLWSIGERVPAQGRPAPTSLLDLSWIPIPVQLAERSGISGLLDQFVNAAARSTGSLELLRRALSLVSWSASQLRNRLDEVVRSNSTLRRGWYVVDLLLAAVRGLISDGVVLTGEFALIDSYDLRAWLVLHGASEETVSSGLLKALIYDLTFAYKGGESAQPTFSAATGVYGLLRLLFTYRGAIMWKMNAGMGEVVFAPIYEALHRRGVKFHFGHEVTRIDFDEKERLANEVHFAVSPEVSAPESLPTLCIDSGPLAGELPYWPTDPPDKQPSRSKQDSLTIGPHDLVVYGLPVGTIQRVLSRPPKSWKRCADEVKTVATIALQLWLSADVRRYAPWASRDITVGAYTEPFDTWSDMMSLAGERWANEPRPVHGDPERSVAYFTNAAPPDLDREAAKQQIEEFTLNGLTDLWPGFEPSMVHDQYWRVNSDPSSSYTLSLPGTLAARLSPNDSSVRNLLPVGDWTRNSISAGCIEAAVISGMLAARVLRPDRALAIYGEDLETGDNGGG